MNPQIITPRKIKNFHILNRKASFVYIKMYILHYFVLWNETETNAQQSYQESESLISALALYTT